MTEQEVKEWLKQNSTQYRVWWGDSSKKYASTSGWTYDTYEEALQCFQEQQHFPDVKIEGVFNLLEKSQNE